MSSADDRTSSSSAAPEAQPLCSNCRFWLLEARDSDSGVCRRYPPNMVRSGAEPVLGSLFPDDAYASYPFWALTLEDEWCGEHSPKDKSQEKGVTDE